MTFICFFIFMVYIPATIDNVPKTVLSNFLRSFLFSSLPMKYFTFDKVLIVLGLELEKLNTLNFWINRPWPNDIQ